MQNSGSKRLILTPLTWKIWRAPNNARKWHKGFNLALKGLSPEFRCSKTRRNKNIYAKNTASRRRRLESSKLYTLDWKSRSRREIKKEWFVTKRWKMLNKTKEIMNGKREKGREQWTDDNIPITAECKDLLPSRMQPGVGLIAASKIK